MGMGAGEKADDEFVSHSSACIQGHEGVGGWFDRADGWCGIGIEVLLLTGMQDRAGWYRRYERSIGEFCTTAI